MDCVLKRNTANTVWKNITSMAVDNTVNTWEPLVDLAVDVAFQVARLCVLLDRLGRFYVIFDQVVW